MKKTVKAWAVFNPWGKALLETVDRDRRALEFIRNNYNAINPGYKVRRIALTYDDKGAK
jgi:hypothetical protein